MARTPETRIVELWDKQGGDTRADLLKILGWWTELDDDARFRLLEDLRGRRPDDRDGLRLRGRIWWIAYSVNGRAVRESSHSRSKQVAADLLAQRRRERDSATLGLPKRTRWTVKDAIDTYMGSAGARAKKSQVRDRWCSRQLVAEFGGLRLADLTRERIEAYKSKRRAEGISESTINRAIALLSAVLTHTVDLGELPTNPIRAMKRVYFGKAPDRKPTLSTEAEEHLLDACPQHLRDLVRFLLATGCRLGEALALDKRHLNFRAGTARIERAKGGEGRDVHVHADLMAELEQRMRRATADRHVFADSLGKRATLHGVGQAFRNARSIAMQAHPETAAELQAFRVHDLRHVFAVRALAAGMNLYELSRQLGHRDASRVTTIYADTTPARMAAAVSALPLAPAQAPEKPAGRLIRMKGQG